MKDRAFKAIFDEERAKCKAANGKCWLCHERIDCDLPTGKHPQSFSLDHVDVVSRGGDTHRRSRLKWSHLACNSARGDGTSTKQLRTSRKW